MLNKYIQHLDHYRYKKIEKSAIILKKAPLN